MGTLGGPALAPAAPQHHGGPMAKSLEGPARGSRGCAVGKVTQESPKTSPRCAWVPCPLGRDSPGSHQPLEPPTPLWHWWLLTPYLWLWQ